MQPYSSTNTATARKNSCFILPEKSDFNMIDNLSIVVHTLLMHILTSLFVNEMLLLRYMNWSTNFRGLTFNEKIALS